MDVNLAARQVYYPRLASNPCFSPLLVYFDRIIVESYVRSCLYQRSQVRDRLGKRRKEVVINKKEGMFFLLRFLGEASVSEYRPGL